MTDDFLLDDPSDYDATDGWRILHRGEDAGTFQSSDRTLMLRGGDRFRVDASEPYDEDSGVDAPFGTIGELVAIAERVGCAGVKVADGKTYIARISDLRAERGPWTSVTAN